MPKLQSATKDHQLQAGRLIKLCIQHNESELWLTAFTNEIENLQKNTTASMSSTIDEIEDALMSLKDVKLKYNAQRNIVKEVLNL